MTEAVEVAIELALLARAQAFAAANDLAISLPNIEFTPPVVSKTAKYLRATFMPADTARLVIGSGSDQHYGFLQLDVFYGVGGGEIAPGRIAANIISYFKRDTLITSNDVRIRVSRTPLRGPQSSKDAWTMLPVRIPYNCYAIPA